MAKHLGALRINHYAVHIFSPPHRMGVGEFLMNYMVFNGTLNHAVAEGGEEDDQESEDFGD